MTATGSTAGAAVPAPVREVRLGLVFNGGVSLAVWMGGVTHEIDCARRAHVPGEPAAGTSALYRELLSKILRQHVRVDVIAGASAGGINGALLAAAIASGKPLAGVRETWMEAGDISSLMRDWSELHPPSLLQGDAKLLPEVRAKLEAAFGRGMSTPEHPLYLYITATNIFGRQSFYRDATGKSFAELDSRHTFSFESQPPSDVPAVSDARAAADLPRWPDRRAGPTPFGHADVTERLARAARSSSSFPAAFEASGPLGDDDYFMDGGVLDNQPFGPLLDRIGVLPAEDFPVRRVVGYVVPYVREPASASARVPDDRPPSAIKTVVEAVLLPRGIPKLQSLDRVTAEHEAQDADDKQRRAIYELVVDPGFRTKLQTSAQQLIDAYRATRGVATTNTFASWNADSFVPGSGRFGQDPTIAVADIATRTEVETDEALERPWVPLSPDWSRAEPTWHWGLSPAERVATWALLVIRDALETSPERPALNAARNVASQLLWDIRSLARQASENFAFREQPELSVADRAQRAYDDLTVEADPPDGMRWLQTRFAELDTKIAAAAGEPGGAYLPDIRTLLHVEVVRNALSIDADAPPFPFHFVFMSARTANSLGHPFETPEQKLAGMKLGHFGAFLKRSWRANDWLWGRLDGVEHLLRATFDREHLKKLAGKDSARLAKSLSDFAFAGRPESGVLAKRWDECGRGLAEPPAGPSIAARFAEALRRAIADDDEALELCRRALAARLQLQILVDELDDVARAVRIDEESGHSARASGASWICNHPFGKAAAASDRIASFHRMTIGAETIADELRSVAGSGLLSRALMLARNVLVGDHGGVARGVRPAVRVLLSAPLRRLWKRLARKALSKEKNRPSH